MDLIGCPHCEAINPCDSEYCYKCSRSLAGRTSEQRHVQANAANAAFPFESAGRRARDGPIDERAATSIDAAALIDRVAAPPIAMTDDGTHAGAPVATSIPRVEVSPPSSIDRIEQLEVEDAMQFEAVADADPPFIAEAKPTAELAADAPTLPERVLARAGTSNAKTWTATRSGVLLGLILAVLAIPSVVFAIMQRQAPSAHSAVVAPPRIPAAAAEGDKVNAALATPRVSPQLTAGSAAAGPETARMSPEAPATSAPMSENGPELMRNGTKLPSDSVDASVSTAAVGSGSTAEVSSAASRSSQRAIPAGPEPPPTLKVRPSRTPFTNAARPSAQADSAVPRPRATVIGSAERSSTRSRPDATLAPDPAAARLTAQRSAAVTRSEGEAYTVPASRCTEAVSALGLCR